MSKTRIIATIALGAALVATSACSSRRPENLPPAPGSQNGGGIGADGSGTGVGAIVPGSRADFLQQVPSDRVYFALDSYSLANEARAVLDSQAQWLNANPAVNVTIEGHADERGTREYNLALGERRANAVRLYLESRGVSAARMQTISWGKERLEAFGSDEQSHARNRRAVTVVPE
ncbi:MAG: peptidoglycan-associated lipoprotein Pal [Allosphingosinicella sp.]|uniref:peptidoglycan-associated lipoprotein Pal n=1 Tax=Allosphingosinicella sp. TaxID=2823234 RepID=UPI003923886C